MKDLIDSRNESLWTELQRRYNITFEKSDNGEYSCFSINDDITFFIVPDNLSKDSFTHEMLHVYLRMKDCYMGAGLKLTIKQSKILSAIMSDKLIEHMGNCLDHIKMLPIYLDMGFNREKFLLDYDTHKCSDNELFSLKANYWQGKKINPKSVDLYIGKLFAIYADPNNSIDYSIQLNALKKIDPMLYQITTDMIEYWNKIKIEDRQLMDDDYHSVLFEYYDNLKKWITKNKIIV